MEVWPGYMPEIQADFSSSYDNAIVRSSLPGKKVQRQSSQRHSETASAKFILTGVQLLIFEYFAHDILNNGADWFVGRVYESGQLNDYPIRILGGIYTVSPYSSSLWSVEFGLEVKRA